MQYRVVKSKNESDGSEYVVEAVNHPPYGDGEIYMTIFTGHHAKERAEEYAAFKNMETT